MMKRLLSLFALLLMLVTSAWADGDMKTVPLTLEAKTAGTIVVSNPQSGMQYSLNGGAKTAVPAEITVSAGDKVAFYGNGTSITSYYGDTAEKRTKVAGGTAECYIYGNIMSLVDETEFTTATTLTGANAFRSLFSGNANLYNHDSKDLVLPATTLADYCYAYMFSGCTGLNTAPELPATTLAPYCYRNMFSGCTGLTKVPTLPATTMAERCYASMFNGCAGLEALPAGLLPATTLATSCYTNMFTNCTELTSVPAGLLPATTMADNCYQSMFMNCTKLASVPANLLPATTLANVCYRSMFLGCTSLTSAPKLPATTLAPECYFDLFSGCTSLTSAPELPAATLAEDCYHNMFFSCTNLNAVTCYATDISATNATTNWLNGVAKSGVLIKAEGMTSWPRTVSGIPARWTAYDNNPLTLEAKTAGTIVVSNPKSGMKYSKNGGDKTEVTSAVIDVIEGDKVQFFGNGTSITSYDGTQIGGTAQCYIYGLIMSLVDEENFATATTLTAANAFRNLFSGNTNLYNHDTKELGLSAMTLTEGCYNGMFSGCTNLTSAPALPATTLTNACYQSMFSGCTGLTTAPALPATTQTTACYQGMFSGCTGLTTAPALPATTLANACYQSMFSGCTGLTATPELNATTLVANCYYEMFSGCTILNSVTCLATDISATEATTNWLYNVAATGTFTKAEETDWVTESSSGIPTGWSPAVDPLTIPLTLKVKEDVEGTKTIVISKPKIGMKYKKNNEAIVTASTTEDITINVIANDIVKFYGNGTSITSYYTSDENYTNIAGGTAECYIYGNIMSLVDETGFAIATTLTGANAFQSLFNGNTKLYNHDTKELLLPATTLASYCYSNMFNGCTGLTAVPALPATKLASYCYASMFQGTGLTSVPADLLPATTMAERCYSSMFQGCTGLTSVPADLLPATTLASYCYGSMFRGTGLTSVPQGLLPATKLVNRCYNSMFRGCTELTSVPADLLPATTMVAYSYQTMFYGCTKLKTAPDLPAETLKEGCYYRMFYNCSSLNSVTCLATTITSSGSAPTSDWLYGVKATGTFTKASTADWGARGASKIPSEWTVVNKATLTDGNDVSALTPCAGEVCIVEYKRAFTEYKPSTVCLPFDYAKKDGEKFYSFTGVEKDSEGNFVATMTEYTGAKLVANTPYLYVSATTGETDFSGTYTLPDAIEASTTTSGYWTFVGTYTTQTWDTAPTGIYGFSAQDTESGISKGEFVKVGAYVRVKPMRSYLKYMDGSEDYHNACARGFGNTTDSESLPERIKVRFVDADGTVTGIGTLNTQTGVVSFDSEAWYTQDGIRLSAKPTKKGIYVNNGKKVMVK